jgi:hypothetical protein
MHKITLDYYLDCKKDGLSIRECGFAPFEITKELFAYLLFKDSYLPVYMDGSKHGGLYQIGRKADSRYDTFTFIDDTSYVYLGELPLFEKDINKCYEVFDSLHSDLEVN